ncbi:MAG: exonuclease SbcCD subunit D [Clostridia bacterium]|nr:exonuclease SbcCD subunit D [Clostridia bacterium]
MTDDQRYILDEICALTEKEAPDAVIIAGDVYDKGIPSTEAMEIFDDFLVGLSKKKISVMVIAGNHDSAERLSFGSRLIEASGIHICPAYDGKTVRYTLEDENGPVNVYLLPFIKPSNVRAVHPDAEINSYTDAVKVAVSDMNVNAAERNVLVAHQFVTGAKTCDSEELTIGGLDNVDAGVFDDFDYVALGHIHSPQFIESGNKRIRYCGTPLKYSFSEARQHKSVTIAELGKKGELDVRLVPLTPKRDMVEIKGKYEEITARSYYIDREFDPERDYFRITLTDDTDVLNGMERLRVFYKNLLRLDYENERTAGGGETGGLTVEKTKSPLELFAEFFAGQYGAEMTNEQAEYMRSLISNIWEGKDETD